MKDRFEELKSIVVKAGKIVKEGFYAHKEVKHKDIVDLVTQYDVKTEEFLINELKKLLPEYTLIGEESFNTQDIHAKKAIYIDPIDGTTNFVHQIPHCAISVGVWEDGEPLCGVVYNPILDELFYGFKDKGAYLNDKKISVSNQDKLQSALIATGFPYSKAYKGASYRWVVDTIANLLPYIQDIRRLGSAALDICYLSAGRFDGFYEIELKPWDVAGAIPILIEAGGRVSSLENGKYCIGDDAIVVTNSKIHQEILDIIGKNVYIRNT